MKKECSKCRETKPFECFTKDKKGKRGVRAECKDCEKKRHEKYLPSKKERSKKRWENASKNGDIQYWNIRADRMNSRAKLRFQKKEKVKGLQLMNLYLNHKKCYYCETPFSNHQECHIDHVIPLAQNGDNSIGNMVPSCEICNSAIKNNKDPHQMLEYVSKVYETLYKKLKTIPSEAFEKRNV